MTTTLTVGFADLCGFTRLSQQLDEGSLLRLLDRFDALTSSVVPRPSVRLVKTIGDEVMFTATDPNIAAAVAIELVERASSDDELPGLKVGLSTGPVVMRRGDCFGTTVNLASRIVDAAPCETVLVDDDTRLQLAERDSIACAPFGVIDLKDFDATPLWRLQPDYSSSGQTRLRASMAPSSDAL